MKEHYYSSVSAYFTFIVLVSYYIELTNSNIIDQILVSYRGLLPSNQGQQVQNQTNFENPSEKSTLSNTRQNAGESRSRNSTTPAPAVSTVLKYTNIDVDIGKNYNLSENSLCDSRPCHPAAICVTLGIFYDNMFKLPSRM